MKIFITGNSRSGTTMMSRILGNHRDVFTFQELHFFDELLPAGKAATIPEKNAAVKLFATLCAIQRNGYFGSRNTKPFIDDALAAVNTVPSLSYMGVFENFLISETQRQHKSVPCEQTPQNIFSLNEILDHFSDARIIIMVRDPREILLSQKFKWKRREHSGGKIPLREAIRARINYHPVTISRIWNAVMRTAMKYKNNTSVLFVNYEALIRDPVKVVSGICNHCGISFNDAMLDIPVIGSSNFSDNILQKGIDSTKTRQWEKGGLNNTEIFICQKINSSMMQQFGYETKPVKPDVLLKTWYYLSLPFRLGLALLFNLKRLRNAAKILAIFK